MIKRSTLFSLIAFFAMASGFTGCGMRAGTSADKPLKPSQIMLLDTAFEAASSFPIVPHIKSRSLAQEKVVQACLKLEQPERALTYIKDIQNFRRGTAYADLALYWTGHGQPERAADCLRQAIQVSEDKNLEIDQDDSAIVKEKIADVFGLIGNTDQADKITATLTQIKPELATAMKTVHRSDKDAFADKTKALQALLDSRDFDLHKYSVKQAAILFDINFNDAKQRAIAEQVINNGLGKVTLLMQMEVLMQLAESSLKHNDPATALSKVEQAQSVLDNSQWPPDLRIQLTGQVSRLRYLSGDEEKAKKQALDALAAFNKEVTTIKDYNRAHALRPIAEAYQAMGDTALALSIYKEVVRLGAINPNINPRTNDLTETCVSMALYGLEPDAQLWEPINEVKKGLGKPPVVLR